MGVGPRPGDLAQAKAIAARKKRERTVFGENAAEKARTPVVQAARETVDRIIQGESSRTASDRLRALALSHSEQKDVQSYSRAKSKQWQRENDVQENFAGHLIGSNVAKLLPGGSPAREASPAWVAAELAMTLPVGSLLGRGGRVVGKAAEAVRPAGAEKIIESLPEAKKLRREQEAGYSAELSKRATKVDEALRLGGEVGEKAALAQLKGELPKLRMGDGLKDFDQASTNELLTMIAQHDDLRPFEKVRTQRALRRLIEGTVITRSENKLLERAFGSDLAAQVAAGSASLRKKLGNGVLSVINVPRSVQSAIDLSAPFRQGLVLGARHPRMFASEFKPMLKAFAREGAYEETMDAIASMPNYSRMEKARLALTDLEGPMVGREDYFNSQLAETLTGGRKLSPVRMSGRAYTAFLNKFRADAFNQYVRMADEAGLDIDDEHLLRSIGDVINTGTGRGSIKKLEPAMNALTGAFFSPRLIASRLQFFNPGRYSRFDPFGADLHPFAREQNRKAARNLLGGIGLTLALAEWAGADVIRDPRNIDFGKIKIGDTRIDITGGHQGYVVNAYRVIKGESVSSTTGEVTKLEGGFGNRSRLSVLADFGKNKLAPVARYGVGLGEDENFAGDKFDPLKEAGKSLVPIGVASTIEAYKQGGAGSAAATAGLGGIGFGVGTYVFKPSKGVKKAYKEQLKAVDQAVRKGEISEQDAGEFRKSARATFEAEVREKQLAGLKKGDDDSLLRRQLVIDDAVRQNMPLKEVNELIRSFGWKPVTPDDLEDTEMDLLELRAVDGG